ncbi:MAG TPA: phosphatase PAP2 family protein, partial [Candidatus Acidoferrales bacterium]
TTEVAAILIPAAYLFVGLILDFCYNDVIAALRFTGRADVVFNRVDSWILLGHSVGSMAPLVPVEWVSTFRVIYGAMFPQVGVCLLFLSLSSGLRESLRFIGTLLNAYYIGLLLFFLAPTAGPSYLAASDPAVVRLLGREASEFARMLDRFKFHHVPTSIGLDYLIAFPSMHIAVPLVVLWYMRRWRRVAFILAIYDLIMAPTLILLMQHYVIDLIGGVAVAILSIAMIEGLPAWEWRQAASLYGRPGTSESAGAHLTAATRKAS